MQPFENAGLIYTLKSNINPRT